MNSEEQNDSIESRISDLDRRLIEQEHRIFSIVKNVIKYSYDEPNRPKFKSALVSLVSYFLKRQTLIIILSALTGIISIASIFISWQSKNLLDDQNMKIEVQNQLIEADRRSSLVFLFNNVMDELSKDLKDSIVENKLQVHAGLKIVSIEKPAVPTYKYSNLSKPLIGRIIALSRRLKPYKSYNYDRRHLDPLSSPERGQLLINLLESGADSIALDKVFTKGTFEYADLENYGANKVNLSFIDLKYANLKDTNFSDSNFNNSKLNYADLSGANLQWANMRNADLSGANLSNAILSNFKVENMVVHGAIMDNMIIYSGLEPTVIKTEEYLSSLDEKNVIGVDYIRNHYVVENNSYGISENDNRKVFFECKLVKKDESLN